MVPGHIRPRSGQHRLRAGYASGSAEFPPGTADTRMAARLFLVLALGWINGANAALHSLAFMRTTSSEVPNLPERVEVGSLDDVPFCRYDSNRRRVEPKQDWMTRVAADDPEYLERETQRNLNSQIINNDLLLLSPSGVHIIQTLFSCQWDDVTGEVGGQMQHAYDGEDFLSFDLKTLTWTAASQQAVITKHKWDNDEGLIKYAQHYLTQECPEFLKKFLDYGKSSFLRTELPSLALLQKTPSSPIVCHATGFYPPRAMLFWTKDGEELHEDVEIGEVLPNLDGTFQMMAELKLSDPAEAWERYSCVFQIGDVNRTTKVTTLEKDAILTNRKPDRTVPIAVSVAALVLLAAAAAVGVVKCRRGGEKTGADFSRQETRRSTTSWVASRVERTKARAQNPEEPTRGEEDMKEVQVMEKQES
ncbi:major histocompatibility complex class I-related gene protein-like [Neosynchiropus ocellatus]